MLRKVECVGMRAGRTTQAARGEWMDGTFVEVMDDAIVLRRKRVTNLVKEVLYREERIGDEMSYKEKKEAMERDVERGWDGMGEEEDSRASQPCTSTWVTNGGAHADADADAARSAAAVPRWCDHFVQPLLSSPLSPLTRGTPHLYYR
ncbi:hypothetical protein WAI453_001601 [Rhynchosporium graminicola]